MTKEQIIAALNGESPKDEQSPDNKIDFTKRGVATKEQSKYLAKMFVQKDEQDSFRNLSRFMSGNVDNAEVRDVLKCHTVMVGTVVLPLETAIVKEGLAFNKDGYFCYSFRLLGNSLGFGIFKDSRFEVTPWDRLYGADAVVECVRNLKAKIYEKMGFMSLFRERANDEIADVIEKAFKEEEEVTA